MPKIFLAWFQFGQGHFCVSELCFWVFWFCYPTQTQPQKLVFLGYECLPQSQNNGASYSNASPLDSDQCDSQGRVNENARHSFGHLTARCAGEQKARDFCQQLHSEQRWHGAVQWRAEEAKGTSATTRPHQPLSQTGTTTTTTTTTAAISP